jgi:hypothetical protein
VYLLPVRHTKVVKLDCPVKEFEVARPLLELFSEKKLIQSLDW